MAWMRRLLAIATLGLLLTGTPVLGQRGGQGAAGGHGGGFSGHSGFGGRGFSGGSHMGGGRAFSGAHARGGLGPRSFGRGAYRAGRGHSGIGLRIRSYNRFGRGCWGYGCGWGWGWPYLGGGIDPYWWWNSDSGDSGQQSYDEGAAQNIAPPWRGPESGDQDSYPRPAPQRMQPERTEPAPATVLVFRDQHKQEVKNYAIVGQALWAFGAQKIQKIPLSDLDLAATAEINDENGVTFRLPGTNGGQ